jgi:hypothetical protein
MVKLAVKLEGIANGKEISHAEALRSPSKRKASIIRKADLCVLSASA